MYYILVISCPGWIYQPAGAMRFVVKTYIGDMLSSENLMVVRLSDFEQNNQFL